MALIGKIAVSAATYAIDKPYSYLLAPHVPVQPGMRVAVPFGRGNRQTLGVVLGVEEGEAQGLKSVAEVLDTEPLLSQTQLRLAAFLRERCFCTYCDAVRAMLPAPVWFHTDQTISLTEERSWEEAPPRREYALQVLTLLKEKGGQARQSALEEILPDEQQREKVLSYLLKKHWIARGWVYRPAMGDKTEKIASLTVCAEEALDYAAGRPRSAAKQRAVLELLAGMGAVSVKELCYYTGASADTIKRLETLGYVALKERPVLRCSQIRPAQVRKPLVLSEQQQRSFEELKARMESPNPGAALLYGVTGSGKTSVYIALIERCLKQDRAAMLLVPEIALTPQLLGLMAAYFGDQVAILHSSLPAGQRRDQWFRVRRGQAKVIVGTRSAVFAPCQPGLIILDEEQEHSYKSESSPRYSARDVALWRGMKEGALVLLGSATPSIETMYRAKTGTYFLSRLTGRYNGRPLPSVEIVDMRRELEEGNDTSLSIPLRQGILENVQAGQQTVLLLNRRGNSRAVVCVDCAKAPECPRCAQRLTYHSANRRLMCHYCGFSQSVPQRCPQCGGPLKTLGVGTQKVQQELSQLFPDLTTIRMDTDTISAVNTHEKILERFQKEDISILIGTQMVAKGLNLPKVTLVGVLDADLSLYSGGYRAGETTFQLLTQVVGRAGRGDSPGRAVIQTLNPRHQVIGLAAKQDYDGFYALEENLRRVLHCPPFGDVVLITFTGEDEQAVIRGAVKFRDSLGAMLQGAGSILGPAPCPVPKINYRYRYQLTLRCRMNRQLCGFIGYLLVQFGLDKETRGVSAFADINGFE